MFPRYRKAHATILSQSGCVMACKPLSRGHRPDSQTGVIANRVFLTQLWLIFEHRSLRGQLIRWLQPVIDPVRNMPV